MHSLVKHWNAFPFTLLSALLCSALSLFATAAEPETTKTEIAPSQQWQVGVGKVDITPTEPVRLSGYAARSTVMKGVSDPIYVRSVLLQPPSMGKHLPPTLLMISIDSIGVPGSFTQKIAEEIEKKWNVPREQLTLCCSHSHTTPHLTGGLTNLFAEPLTAEESAAMQRYTELLRSSILDATEKAFNSLRAATLHIGRGEATFAANRRVLANKAWTGIGVEEGGVKDHSVPIMVALGEDQKPVAVLFNYACHCTTMGSELNQISGDWAGLAASSLEKKYVGAVALCSIGCGADINPNPRGTYEQAQLYSMQLTDAVAKVINHSLQPLTLPIVDDNADYPVQARFGFAGLAPERPSREKLNQYLEEANPHRRNWAKGMIALWEKMGRIPETYPVPIHTWKFGDELTWVFLGGEVVTDYQLRMKRELPGKQVWVSAYTDDVFGYVASERMRKEGGYEVDESMIYYSQPGRWQSGTEDLIVKRTLEILDQEKGEDRPLSPEESLKSISVAEGYEVQLVACEPIIQDPVNIAFGHDGKLWVVEMRDYPEGNGGSGGAIKFLEDTDGDGIMDKSTLFLDGLSFPNGVFPWREGIVVSCAPEIFYAEDKDGDGRCDYRETLVTGFPLANPQHRVNGFTYGLDHQLHLSGGEGVSRVTARGNEGEVSVGGRDLVLNPDKGSLSVSTGTTQFIRSRDDWGNWFGNSNSYPMYHYVFDQTTMSRATNTLSGPTQQLFTPAATPPVFPSSRTVDRFNDLYTANRFTSACSAIVARSPSFQHQGKSTIYVCEPVHNLVHRSQLVSDGASFRAERFPEDEQSEFFRSADPWCRPVRVENGPDGALWVVDMYRRVIEHTEWIPLSWQAQINVRAGEDRGRIYRVVKENLDSAKEDRTKTPASFALTAPSKKESSQTERANAFEVLLEALQSDIGPRRDLAQQQIIWSIEGNQDASNRASIVERLDQLLEEKISSETFVQVCATLDALGSLKEQHLLKAFVHPDERVVRWGIETSQTQLLQSTKLRSALLSLMRAEAANANRVLTVSLICAVGGLTAEHSSAEMTSALAQYVVRNCEDRWMQQAVVTIAVNHRAELTRQLVGAIQNPTATSAQRESLSKLLVLLIDQEEKAGSSQSGDQQGGSWIDQLIGTTEYNEETEPSALWLAASWLTIHQHDRPIPESLKKASILARSFVLDEALSLERRLGWIKLTSIVPEQREPDLHAAASLLGPQHPLDLQFAAIDCFRRAMSSEYVDLLLSRYSGCSPAVQSQIMTLFLSREKWREALIESFEKGRIEISQVDASSQQILRSLGNRSLQARVDKLLGAPIVSDRQVVVEKYLKDLPKGDRLRGEAIYRTHCAVCHSSQNGTVPVGAILTALSDRSSTALVTSILHPNKAVEAKYRQVTVETSEDEVLQGVVLQESTTQITLGLADSRQVSIDRSDVAQWKDSGLSLMPEGFERQLSLESMGDLVAYLQWLGSKK